MVVIPPMDAQAGETIWRLLTGAAQDSWEAICKHSHPQSHSTHATHTATPELRPRRGGGGWGGDNDYHNSQRAEGGRGSGSNNNNNNNNDNNNTNNNNNNNDGDNDSDNNNRGSSRKTTTADDDTTTAAAADPTTTAAVAAKTTATTEAAAAAATTSTTPAAAATTTPAAETSEATTEAVAANTAAADTTSAQAAAAALTITDDAATPTAANDENETTAAATASETAAATAAAAAATSAATSAAQAAVGGETAAIQAAGDTTTAAAVAAATQAAGAGSESTYVNTNGQTTTRHVAATTTGATGTIGAPAATGTSTSSTASGSGAETSSSSNTGLIAGVVVGAILFLVLAFAVYWFRHSKYVKALCCCCGMGGGRNVSNKNGGGSDDSDDQSHARHMADSNAHLVSRASAGSPLTPMSSSVPAAAMAFGKDRDEKRGYNDMLENMNFYGSDAKSRNNSSRAILHDGEKREMAARDLNVRSPPPVSMKNVLHSPTSPLTPTSAMSSTSSSAASASAHKPAHRQRSPSYSTFPSVTRSHNYSNSITRAQAGALPTPPPTAVQKDRQASHASQSSQSSHSVQYHQKQNSVPRVAVQVAELPADPPSQATGFPFKEKPMRRLSRTAPSPLALSTSNEGLAPPPRSSTTRQRQSTASHDVAVHEKDTDDTASLAPTFSRSSYTESIGGESISSSVLMSPALLQWPVPPNTPPVSHFGSEADGALTASNSNSNLSSNLSTSGTITAGRSKSQESIESGSTDTNSQGSGPLFDRVAIVPSHMPIVVSATDLPVPRRPLTTVSSVENQNQPQNQPPVLPLPNRGSMPTRASLSGPSSRSLLQMQSARRPSVASSGSGSIGQAVSGPPPTRAPYPPYAHSQRSQSPRSPRGPPPPAPGSPRGMPVYQQQQYPHPQHLPPTGYIPPQASAVTVHHTGQATSVRVPIARNSQRY